MYPKKERVKALLVSAIKETELLLQMSGAIQKPDDFLTSLTGMTVYRACGMSLQFITESLVKIRNLCGQGLFKCYTSIPWNSVFGMRNFLSHEYGEVDAEGIFGTIKTDIPDLLSVIKLMLSDLNDSKLDGLLKD